MKKKIIATVLFFVLYLILASCNSCTPGNAQTINNVSYDTVYVEKGDLLTFNFPDTIAQDTAKVIIIKKEIKPMEIDTTWKIRRDSLTDQLEKTGKDLKIQQRTIDSMLVVKKK